MITFTQLAPNIVQVSGMDTRLLPPAAWRIGVERMARNMQRKIAARYKNERTAQQERFRRNTSRWNQYKAKHNYAPERGQMLRRIIHRIMREELFSVSVVTPMGTCIITFSELLLYTREPHARWYAKNKVPGGRILTVNALDIERSGGFVRELDIAANRVENQRLRNRALAQSREISISTGQATMSVPAGGRRVLTLARTAWAAAAKASAKLSLLGRR